jgi:hypothetical protein
MIEYSEIIVILWMLPVVMNIVLPLILLTVYIIINKVLLLFETSGEATDQDSIITAHVTGQLQPSSP